MIEITIFNKSEKIIAIQVKGHSGYAEEGSDIICSAVSTLAQNCEIGLKELLKIQTNFVRNPKLPLLSVALPNDLSEQEIHDSQIIMKSTRLGLKKLADSYPKYINIKEK
ncbi:MAG: ribosomal-processing cysteine protease Prp [Clostridia bacterium]|nr:ribosomal-processing cysteine protease Prp [Clostridia bacterium]